MASDYRMMWVELDNSSILGKHIPSSHKINASKAKSTDPRARNKYNRRVKKRYAKAKVGFQCTALQDLVKEFPSKVYIMRCYDLLHRTTSDIRRDAEEQRQILCAGEVLRSPRLQTITSTAILSSTGYEWSSFGRTSIPVERPLSGWRVVSIFTRIAC